MNQLQGSRIVQSIDPMWIAQYKFHFRGVAFDFGFRCHREHRFPIHQVVWVMILPTQQDTQSLVGRLPDQ